MKIFTIGHSTTDINHFISLLKENNIRLLIDVRSYPGSRYVPWFNKETISGLLASSDIEYYHMSALGGRKKSFNQESLALVNSWKNKSFLNYAAYSLTSEYEKGIEELIKKAKQKQVAIVCAESVPWRCHRLLISNSLLAKGIDVYHIISSSNLIKHSLNKYGAFAIIHNGKVIYPKQANKKH